MSCIKVGVGAVPTFCCTISSNFSGVLRQSLFRKYSPWNQKEAKNLQEVVIRAKLYPFDVFMCRFFSSLARMKELRVNWILTFMLGIHMAVCFILYLPTLHNFIVNPSNETCVRGATSGCVHTCSNFICSLLSKIMASKGNLYGHCGVARVISLHIKH